jgi:hypothetical protein
MFIARVPILVNVGKELALPSALPSSQPQRSVATPISVPAVISRVDVEATEWLSLCSGKNHSEI